MDESLSEPHPSGIRTTHLPPTKRSALLFSYQVSFYVFRICQISNLASKNKNAGKLASVYTKSKLDKPVFKLKQNQNMFEDIFPLKRQSNGKLIKKIVLKTVNTINKYQNIVKNNQLCF